MSAFAGQVAMVVAGSMLTCAAHAGNCTAAPVSGKTYNIVNEGSGLYLDVLSKKTTDGADVGQYASNGGTNQQWKVTSSKDSSGNTVWQIVAVHSDKALDVYGWSTADGGPIKQWTAYQNNDNQRWALKQSGNGGMNIVSVHSQKFVTVGDNKSLSTIYQKSDQSSAYQRWYFNPVDGNCPSSFGSFLGGNKLLIGVSTGDDNTALKAPFPLRYRYIHSQVPKDQSCYKQCSDVCKGWWGCWSDSQWNHEAGLSLYQAKTPPKTMATSLVNGETQDEIMFWTWYSLRDLGDQGGYGDGPGEVNTINDAKLLQGYLNDYRFFLQKIGAAKKKNVIHLEPDFWGYVNSINSNPHLVPAKVTEANSTDCSNEENSAAGLASCLISMARKYSPDSIVGIHTSCWNWKQDGGVAKCVQFYKDLGATKADILVTDATDRDAGWREVVKKEYEWWWDADFTKYLTYIKALTEGVGKSIAIWQIPLGNWNMNNTYQHYKDNKVDHFFSHTSDVVNAHIVAVLFGSGQEEQTTPETDGGYLVYKTKEYWKTGGTQLR